MRSIVLEQLCATAVLCWVAADALAGTRQPTHLIDPTFQIKYDSRVVEFEPMAPSILGRCQQTDLPNLTPVFFVYARTVDDQGRVFYATGGYEFRTNPKKPSIREYHVGGLGLIFFMDGERCQEIGSIMETFTAGAYEETSEKVLSGLAADMAARYEKAFGPNGLKEAFRKRRIKRNQYAPELNKAFAPYYVR